MRRYRNLALKWHPLRSEDGDAQANFDEVSESFEVLSNYELRALFDKFGELALKEGVADGNGGAYALTMLTLWWLTLLPT